MTKEEMGDWILKFCVTEHHCEPGHVAMIGWFPVPVSQLAAQGLADMALFNDGLKYAFEMDWVESTDRSTMFRLTPAGYERGKSVE